jgi:hypothetical protein
MNPDLIALYAPPPDARPEHHTGLEAELLRHFDASSRPAPRWLHSRPLRRLALGSALVAGLAAASQAPVEHAVEVGHRFTITLPPGTPLPPLDALSSAFHEPPPSTPGPEEARVEIRAHGSQGQVTLEADVWSDASPSDIESRLSALPALAGATISVTTLEGKAQETLAERLGEELFNVPMDKAAIEAARERLQAELAAQGVKAQVDVQVEDGAQGQKRVTVKVTKEASDEDSPGAPVGH